jgi:tRNA A-37 threonylcarbamoyl transferase component Bud32
MYVAAASFLLLHFIEAYLVVWGPVFPDGLDAAFESGTVVVYSVEEGTRFSRAGLQAGDRVLTVSGLPIRAPRDWGAALANLEVGRPQIWEVLRGGSPLQLSVTFEAATPKDRFDLGLIEYLAGVVVFVVLGLFIAFRRPHDHAARLGGLLFMSTSAAFGLLNGWAPVWRESPVLVQFLLWIPEISRFVLEAIFLSFVGVFPRRLFHMRWIWFAIWIPVLATLPWRAFAFYSVIYRFGHGAALPSWLNQTLFFRAILYVAVGLLFLMINYRRFADLNEKRRIRVLMVGTTIALGAGAYSAWVDSVEAHMGSGMQSVASWRVIPLLILISPLTFGYAILRHRILDIHVIIRQGLQYALARGVVIGVIPALAAVLVADLAINSQKPLSSILRARGWAYVGVGGLALLASVRRKQWLEALDRRFFRERYDTHRVLLEIVGEIHETNSLDRVASRVVERIETALHPEFVSVMVHENRGREYRSLASVPAGQSCPPIDVNSKLVALLRVLGKPLELQTGSRWMEARLADEEMEFVRRSRIELLVPIRTAPGQPEALLALGVKHSEEPYTREDQDLLEAIASSLGRLLERPAAGLMPAPAETFEECPTCGACYDAGSGRCMFEGATLTSIRLPRTLAGRYWLERRHGRGGMGSIYAARDQALGRRVAVKVIRDDLVGSAEIAQRFHREARVAAAFAHPNVVTVHDYGVEAGTRAFLVMELLEGNTLRDELNCSKHLEPSRLLNIFRGVTAAVIAAHQQQLIHRDLKPENIYLAHALGGTEETVKVLDFGIAKFLPACGSDEQTRSALETNTGLLIGTLAYMSPEQLNGENPAVSWDLWSLAVVAYEALTGALPFPFQPALDWRRSIMACSFTPLSEYLPDSPQRWHIFFAQMFSTDLTVRAKSASEFLRSLEEAFS